MAMLDILGLLSSFSPYLPYIFVIYLIVTRTRTWYRLRHFPGPFLAKFSYVFMAKTGVSGKMNVVYTDVNKKYGSLARIGPNDLITDDPDIIRMMSSARSQYIRSDWYAVMRVDPYINSIFSELDVTVHDKRRAKMAGAYGGKENPTLDADINSCIDSLFSSIRRRYISQGGTVRPMDFTRILHYFTLDVITKVAYGEAFGYLEEDKDLHGYIETTDKMVPYLSFMGNFPAMIAILRQSWLRVLIGPKPTDKTGPGKLMGMAEQVVAERFGPDKKERKDMLGAFVRNGIPQRQIEAEVLFQIQAGSDTTAAAFRGVFLYLLTNPRVHAKLLLELNSTSGSGSISTPITNTEAKTLPYLQAVIKEAMRIQPPFAGMVPKKVPPQGDTIKGQFVPGGTNISHNPCCVQRKTSIYGADTEVFRPERWIEASEEDKLRMEQALDLNFGYGRWGCLGKNIALRELDKVVFELLRNFEFEMLRPECPWKSKCHDIFLQEGMWVRVTERENM